jgi:hypothetical protein
VKNISRRAGSSNGGDMVAVDFITVTGTNSANSGVQVNNNICINDYLAADIDGVDSDPVDIVNIYQSNGNSSNPIQIYNNKIKGGGPRSMGGGIILGDQNGSYQVAQDNILYNPGQYGVAIAGGHNNVLRRNKVYSDDQRDFTNVGLYIYRFNSNKHGTGTAPGDCYNHTVEYNEITFYRGPNYKNSGQPAILSPSWDPDYGSDKLTPNCGAVSGWSTNKFDTESSRPANLDSSIWDPNWDNQ